LIIGTLSLRGDFFFGCFDLKSREEEKNQVLEDKYGTWCFVGIYSSRLLRSNHPKRRLSPGTWVLSIEVADRHFDLGMPLCGWGIQEGGV